MWESLVELPVSNISQFTSPYKEFRSSKTPVSQRGQQQDIWDICLDCRMAKFPILCQTFFSSFAAHQSLQWWPQMQLTHLRHSSLLLLVTVMQILVSGAPKKWHSLSQVHIVQGKASGTAHLLGLVCNAFSHLPSPTWPIFPKDKLRSRGRARLKNIIKRARVLLKAPLLQHILTDRSELHVQLFFSGAGVFHVFVPIQGEHLPIPY